MLARQAKDFALNKEVLPPYCLIPIALYPTDKVMDNLPLPGQNGIGYTHMPIENTLVLNPVCLALYPKYPCDLKEKTAVDDNLHEI